MPSQYPYRQTIRNDYLGVSKVVRAMSVDELHWLVGEQRRKWAGQEARRRQSVQREAARAADRLRTDDLRQQAEDDTRAARQRLDALRGILAARAANSRPVDWDALLDRRAIDPFVFDRPKPDRDALRLKLLGPPPVPRSVRPPEPEPPGGWDWLLPPLRRRREEREAAAGEEYERAKERAAEAYAAAAAEYKWREKEVVAAYNAEAVAWNTAHRKAKADHARRREALAAELMSHNAAVLDYRARYEAGSPEAVEGYAQMVLDRSEYPDGVPGEPDAQFDGPSQTLVVNFRLPGPADVPNVVEHKFVASRKEVKPVEMKPKDFAAFYDDVLHQIGLRAAHEVFAADTAGHIHAVVFNGWVKGIDPKTGKPFTSCVLSFQAPREKFLDLDLARVSPKECVRGLKGVTAGPLVMVAPVKPVMELKRDDDRFVESKEVLDQMRPDENLAAMEWEDFEHLVRELFEREFAKDGGEVRVTQASRDRGVDAVAFDPDPIRGGKFVIQAKRYNMVVPSSAVRELFGTMMSEGAVKGILVTTSHFGPDSFEFAKDKPIALIDGANLVHLFQKHGRNVSITLLPKGDPRRGIG